MTIVDCSTRLPTKPGPYAVLVKPYTGYHITMDKGVAWDGRQWVCDDGESTPFDDETSRVVAWVDLDDKHVAVQPPTTPPPVEEPETYRITVTAFVAGQKIALIKTVRALTGLGLGEAKAVVEALPGKPLVVKEVSPRAEAKTIRDQLVAAGALGVQLEAA